MSAEATGSDRPDGVPASINIRPSARILKVLGDIEFEPWQCLAELVDNSFDEYSEIERTIEHWPEQFLTSIGLPSQSTPLEEAEVTVADTGRGMDLGELQDGVRAGWSGNDPFSKLGLFGMGFNIATARLGQVASVLTTRAGDAHWVGVSIDLDSLTDDFDAPTIVQPKQDINDHGTRVTINRLDPSRCAWLSRNAANLRTTLGRVYSHLLGERTYTLLVNGVQVNPREPCRWSDAREVTFGKGRNAETIQAHVEIDQELPAASVCVSCRNWQELGRESCDQCGSEELTERQRRIRGWLGIQRYLHATDFGIDFLRNGRKILIYDKRLFDWKDPNDPLGGIVHEYPVELGQGGRIIGEIHLDHVAVNYQKNAFEWGDKGWIHAVDFLRGTGPILPDKAKRLGYPQNNSPLGRLHRGYRRNDPGLRYLIPGNGEGPIHEKTREWAQQFFAGTPAFQSDRTWWEAVQDHERIKQNRQTPDPGGGPETPSSDDVLQRLGLERESSPETRPETAVGFSDAARGETEEARLLRLKTQGVPNPELSGDFGLLELGARVQLSTYLLQESLREAAGKPIPVLMIPEGGGAYGAFVDTTHTIFTEFLDDYATYVLLELAHHLKVRADSDLSLSQIVSMLKERCLPDSRFTLGTLGTSAREALHRIRDLMVTAISENPDRAWQFLTQEERSLTETVVVAEGGGLSLTESIESGSFVQFAPPLFLPRLVESWPDAFLDGSVFRGQFSGLISPAARATSVARVVGYLYDAATVVSASAALPDMQMRRLRLGLELLRAEIVPDSQ